jgi:hypothetical protein
MRKGHQDFVTVVSDIDPSQLIEVIDSHEQGASHFGTYIKLKVDR